MGFGICAPAPAAEPPSPAEPAAPAAGAAEPAPAPSRQTLAVTGRVFNTVTGYYVRSAEVRLAGTDNIVYTEDGGAYRIEVPAGPVTLTASYAGVQSATLTLDARPGAPNILDFELQPLGAPAAAAAPGREEIVMLEALTVSEERVGQAKAIQEQRAAINVKTVIATDNFGELTQGNMGEFLKYMPGIALDYTEVEATGVRIGGLDPKYTGFSTDGINLASANSSASRALDIASVSITGIEAIEFNQTLTASMDPASAAGNINLKSKYSFNIKKNTFRYQIGLDGTSDALDFGRDYMPDDKLHYRIHPGGMLNYGGTFFNRRLGLEASVSSYTSYVLQTFNQVRYSYYTGDLPGTLVSSPVIAQITWRPGPKIYERTAANLSFDFKITPKLILSLRGNYNKSEGEYMNLYTRLAAYDYTSATASRNGPSLSIQTADSTLTNWVVTPTNATSTNSRLYTEYSRHRSKTVNQLLSPRLSYKNGPLNIELRTAYTKARSTFLDGGEHMFRSTGSRMSGIGWTATRPSEGSPAWTLTQTDGMDWRVPQNWSRSNTYDSVLYTNPEVTENEQFSGYLDITYARRVFGQPVTFKAGGGARHNDYTYTGRDDRYNYLGPSARQIEDTIPWTQNYIFDYKYGNVTDQNWRADSEYELGRLFMAHPEWFQYDAIRSYARNMLKPREASEDINAAYIEATSRYKAWQFNLGLRYETTTTKAKVTRMRPAEDIAAAKALASQEQIDSGMFDDTASIAGINFKYYNGQRITRERDYDNLFLSGGLKYDITQNLRFQLSASQSILRPNYSNIAGVISFYDTNYSTDIWVPNPILKPERATKYYAGLKYYLNPAGSIGLSAYRLDIRDKQINGIQITQEQAEQQLGFPLRDAIDLVVDNESGGSGSGGGGDESGDDNNDVTVIYTPITYRSTVNVAGTRTIYGVTFDYDQQLTFLPGFLKGLGVFGSYTWSEMQNAREDEEIIGVINHSANGGIKYRYKRFNLQLRASWQDDQLKRVTRPQPGRDWILDDHVYQKSRIIWDLSGGFNLARDLDLVFAIRNVFNAPQILYSNERSRMHEYYDTGAICSVSLKGAF
ncbi:MAG: TonB-dependent receptor [Opitutaceae bacterium]|nr:TonB-dependent receptor [Opitutaceae bacterium]